MKTALPKPKLQKDKAIFYLRQMLCIRLFEEKVNWLFARGKILGTSHLYIGQEAVAVGSCAALAPEDYIVSNHRGHGHLIAKGGAPKRIMAEIFGKVTGYCKGKGGTQHMFCSEVGHMGSNGITGGQIPVATGIAFALKYSKKTQVVLCFLGDGATNQGTFHESLNMAGLWNLPIVYVCENNMYAMSTHVKDAVPVEHIADRAAAYGMPGTVVDGNDVLAVREAVEHAVQRARMGSGPSLVEAKTYRLLGHSKSDPRTYRTKEEERNAWANEPIKRYRAYLLENNILDEAQFLEIEQKIKKEIEDAVDFAEKSAYPQKDIAFEDMLIYSRERR
jgi:pyruvate dehydrogenase E1 component alpha subunit